MPEARTGAGARPEPLSPPPVRLRRRHDPCVQRRAFPGRPRCRGRPSAGRGVIARERLPARRLPPAACGLPFIYLFWWRKAGVIYLGAENLSRKFVPINISVPGGGFKCRCVGKGRVQCGRRGAAGARPSVLNRPEAVGQGQARVSRTRSFRSIQELPGPPWAHGHDGGGCSWGRRARGSCGEKRTPSLPPERGRRRERGREGRPEPGAPSFGGRIPLREGRLAGSLQLKPQPAFAGNRRR